MTTNYMEEAFRPAEEHYRQKVLQDTWGHLAPKRNKTYMGYVIFVESRYGDTAILDADFKGLEDSPWLYEALNDLVDRHKKKPGNVYRFVGTFKNYTFDGAISVVFSCTQPIAESGEPETPGGERTP